MPVPNSRSTRIGSSMIGISRSDDRQDRRLARAAPPCAGPPGGSRAPCRPASSRAASSRRRRPPGTPGTSYRIVVERPVRLAVHDLEVRDGGPAARAPVDDVTAAVDQPLVVELHEGVAHRPGEIGVEREALAAPVERAAEPPQLRLDRVAGLALPGPDALDEASRGRGRAGRSPRFASSRSTTIWVAMPAWSVPGTQSTR